MVPPYSAKGIVRFSSAAPSLRIGESEWFSRDRLNVIMRVAAARAKLSNVDSHSKDDRAVGSSSSALLVLILRWLAQALNVGKRVPERSGMSLDLLSFRYCASLGGESLVAQPQDRASSHAGHTLIIDGSRSLPYLTSRTPRALFRCIS